MKSSTIEAYPLSWPLMQPRTHQRKRAVFKTSFAKARDELIREVGRFNGKSLVISTNIPLRKDGLPYAGGYGGIDDVGVAVYFVINNQQYVFACDKWDRVQDNMHAINKTIEALRGIERWGSSELMTQAFNGFKALPQTATIDNIWTILDMEPTKDAALIIRQYHKKAKDIQQDTIALRDLNLAKDQAIKQAKQ